MYTCLVTLDLPVFLVTPAQDNYVNEGENLILDCIAMGEPDPVVLWYRDVVPENLLTLTNNSLIIRDAGQDDSGRYSCVADNGLGKIFHVFNVLVRSKWFLIDVIEFIIIHYSFLI